MWDRLLLWALRAVWASLPLAAGPALGAVLHGRSGSVQVVASVGLWGGWTAVVVAVLVPHPLALTAVRLGAPAALAAAAAATATGVPSAVAAGGSLAATAAAVLIAFLPEIAIRFVNGAAYPNERRFPLRVPFPLLLGPLPLAWLLAVGAPAVAALLLAARQWAAGGLMLAGAVPLAALLGRALHGLARRWVVFVPAGVVLHDPIGLADPVLFRRPEIAALVPAPVRGSPDVTDLTQGAAGLALELRLSAPVPLVRARPGRRQSLEQQQVEAVRFAPTRPGAVLREARARRLPVG